MKLSPADLWSGRNINRLHGAERTKSDSVQFDCDVNRSADELINKPAPDAEAQKLWINDG